MQSSILLWLTVLAAASLAQPIRTRMGWHLHDRALFDNVFGGRRPSASDVQDAANSFAGDVAVVSNSLNTLGDAPDRETIRFLATKGFRAETDEDNHRSVLFAAAQRRDRTARTANNKIVENTPIVLDGLESIMRNPTPANTRRMVDKMQRARNAEILPSITQLTNAAFTAMRINMEAKTFEPTHG